MTTHKKKFSAYLPIIIGTVLLLAVIGAIVYVIATLDGKPTKKEKKIQANQY